MARRAPPRQPSEQLEMFATRLPSDLIKRIEEEARAATMEQLGKPVSMAEITRRALDEGLKIVRRERLKRAAPKK